MSTEEKAEKKNNKVRKDWKNKGRVRREERRESRALEGAEPQKQEKGNSKRGREMGEKEKKRRGSWWETERKKMYKQE